MFWNNKLDIKPRLTTSFALIDLGIVNTLSTSNAIILPSVSSAITGKKLRSSRIFSLRSSVVPFPFAVLIARLFANSS